MGNSEFVGRFFVQADETAPSLPLLIRPQNTLLKEDKKTAAAAVSITAILDCSCPGWLLLDGRGFLGDH
jgi:hypothetical protein